MASHLPSPPATGPTTPNETPTISAEINSATRSLHTELNRGITACLPYGLPPHQPNATRIYIGILYFAQVFINFEDHWDALEDEHQERCSRKKDKRTKHDKELREFLSTLRPPGIARSERFKKDVAYLKAQSGLIPHRSYNLPDIYLFLQYKAHSQPHVLIAYAWVYYMAIFSGGRWIRKQLIDAGAEFWTGSSKMSESDLLLESPGFSFLSFDGELDGEDIKMEFKDRLLDAESILTPEERQEVVKAAKQCFEFCTDLVRELIDYDQMDVHWQTARKIENMKFYMICAAVAITTTAILCVMVRDFFRSEFFGTYFLPRAYVQHDAL